MLAADYDAILHNWCVIRFGTGPHALFALLGIIEGDRKGRFADGRWVRTSIVVTPIDGLAEGAVVQTLNSRYLLAQPLDRAALAAATRH